MKRRLAQAAARYHWHLGHALPFLLWLGVILLTQLLEQCISLPRAWYPWSYALKSVACALLLLHYKPWRIYAPFDWRELPLALGVGLLVTLVWVWPESAAASRLCPALQEFYHRWLILMPGSLPDYFNPDFHPELPPGHLSRAYAPAEAGWPLTLMRLGGSALVIAPLEEFFFRGFLYRWLRRSRFWELPLKVFDRQAFWTVALLFALEHDRWFAALIAGLLYGYLAVRRGNIWSAAIAHAITNFTLGLYLLYFGRYGFW